LDHDRRKVELIVQTNLQALNTLPKDAFVALLGRIFEHSPWVPEAAFASGPFNSRDALHAAMVAVVERASLKQQRALLCAHPQLARPGTLTQASTAEQGSKGLDQLEGEEATVFDALNSAYSARFGFPFIIAVRGQRDRAAIVAAMTDRVGHSAEQEHQAALAEVAKIARFRLEDLIADVDRWLPDV
jgi:2-oxo-4-hydroxy-4-carboxy-5-ureidoimidazoline decarboxylase